MDKSSHVYDVIIVGGGLIGLFSAICLSQHESISGISTILIVERCQNPCLESVKTTKSITLALSHRGLNALSSSSDNLAVEIKKATIPLTGRAIHDAQSDAFTVQPYARDHTPGADSCIYSIQRSTLIKILMMRVLSMPKIQIQFCTKVTKVELEPFPCTVFATDM